MTEQLFREDSYLKECDAVVVAVDGDAIVLDRTVFYPMGGGQAADTGTIDWEGGSATVIDTRYGDGGAIRHIVEENAARPQVGGQVRASIDWDRRYRHMRMHTALHLLGSILKYGVTGGNISAEKSRLDFDMEDTIDKEEVARALKALVEEDLSPEEQLEKLVRAYVRVALENADMNACYVLELRHLESERRGPLRRAARQLRDLWREKLTAVCPNLDRERADTMVQMAIFSIVSLCLTRSRIDRDSLVELATRQVMRGLLVDTTDLESRL